jgi:hypothetical protein
MIHHVSIAAREPEHVARVLGELLGGYVGRFVGPFPNAWVVYPGDAFGTGIEVYGENTTIVPGEGDAMGGPGTYDPPPSSLAFHALISVKVDRATIERIGAREGWRTRHYWRGPGDVRLFELYEFWVENRIMLELVTEDMLAPYVAIANGPAQQAMLAARLKAR